MRRTIRHLSRGIVYLIAIALVLVGLVVALIETTWGKNQIRALVVRQANRYLTARLEIGRLSGSLVNGLALADIRLSRDGRTIVAIDRVDVSFSLRELFQTGVVIRSVRLTRPRIVAAREPDGRWNLAALIKRDARDRERTGPTRPIDIRSIDVADGFVSLQDPLTFGDVRVPSRFERLNLTLAFVYEPVSWRLTIANASWLGGRSDLAVDRLAGTIAHGRDGWSLTDLLIHTAQSAFIVNGRVVSGDGPATLDLHVAADRFVFQEWGGVLAALGKIPIDSRFDLRLTGPLAKLGTAIDLRSNGGDARGTLVLDTTVPGWRGAGTLTLTRLNLAQWFDDRERASDISGRADFDLALRLGQGLFRGSYVFDGSHAAYGGYQGDHVRARGDITAREWRIARGSAVAYGSNIRFEQSTVALAAPYPFHFRGAAAGVDLRVVPTTIPVPHVESLLAFDYEVTGQFTTPFIAGRARFDDSAFLGARIASGARGSIDTRASPVTYSGEGDLSGVALRRFGTELDWAWLLDPRYAGTVAGHFRVEGAGSDSATMTLDASGRLAHAELFEGTLQDADVAVHISAGSLTGSYDGRFAAINPAIAFVDDRLVATLTGSGLFRVGVPGLLVRSPLLEDYDITGSIALEKSDARGVQLDRGAMTATLSDSRLTVTALQATGPLFDVQGSGSIGLADAAESQFDYDVARADLSLFKASLGEVSGEVTSKGRLTGPGRAIHLTGSAAISHLEAAGVTALTTTGDYDVTFPWDAPAAAVAHVTGKASFLDAFNQRLKEAAGTVSYADDRMTVDLTLAREDGLSGAVAGTVVLHPGARAIDIASAAGSIRGIGWRMLETDPAPTLTWDADGVTVTPLTLVDAANGDQRLALSGTWRPAGGGGLRVTASHVFLDTLTGPAATPALYGGLIDLDATVSGTTEQPIVSGRISVTEGRIRRLTYEKLAGRVDYVGGQLDVDLRLDQSPGVWLTAVGTVPATLFNADQPDQPVNVAIASSDVNLGLVEGLTDVVRDVSGRLRMNLQIAGTTRSPDVTGPLELSNVGFQVVATGARYKNGGATLQFSTDRITVAAFHLEDRRGRPLDIRGSLGTHELRVGDLEVDISARGFEVVRNEIGNVDVDASLKLRGEFDAPRLFGDISIVGGELKVDEVLSRLLFQPYATESTGSTGTTGPNIDAISVLNPWNRLSLEVAIHSQGALHMTGDNVQVTEDAPLGLGSFNLRANGDLFLHKEPDQDVSTAGSLDSITGSYSFQGRRFDLYPSSAIDFRGDFNPGIFITVKRVISGIEARVTITGTLREPELQLSSTPPLDPSDILSLIVFNTPTSDLSASQQQELAVRGATLAAGFLTSSLTSSLTTALERSLNLDILEIEPSTGVSSGAKVTIGEQIAPGLVARFTRQFGTEQYDEAAFEYRIARFLRLRATFSDASPLTRSPFRRVERAGLDLLLSFSF